VESIPSAAPAQPDTALTRDSRQRTLVPPERLAAVHAVVIGVGAIGRQVALQLAAMGVPRMTLIDFDTVGIENMAPQGYWPCDLGQAKVRTTGALCQSINDALEVVERNARFRRDDPRSWNTNAGKNGELSEYAVFCAVDSIETRRTIWESLDVDCVRFFVDGRMSGEVLRALSSDLPGIDVRYADSLFAASEAFPGSCTAKATIYSASVVAGLMVGQYAKWLRGMPTEASILLNLLTMEMTVE